MKVKVMIVKKDWKDTEGDGDTPSIGVATTDHEASRYGIPVILELDEKGAEGEVIPLSGISSIILSEADAGMLSVLRTLEVFDIRVGAFPVRTDNRSA